VSWFKVDDRLTFHPKVLQAGNEAIGAWVRLGAYCGAHLTDGKLPSSIVLAVCGPDLARRLVAFRFLEELPDGTYAMHDYLEYNPSAEQIKAERAANAERQAKWRNGRNAVTNTVSNTAPDQPIPIRSDPIPTNPDPDQPTNQSSVGWLVGEVEGFFEKYPRKTSANKRRAATALAALTDDEKTTFTKALAAYGQLVLDEETPPQFMITWAVFCEGRWREFTNGATAPTRKRKQVGVAPVGTFTQTRDANEDV
jgi:hypothetical protein